LEELFAKLKLAKEGTEDYDKARKEITSKYGNYIEQIQEEEGRVLSLSEAYGKLSEKIEESAKDKFRETAMSDAKRDFSDAVNKIYKRFSVFGEGHSIYTNLNNMTAIQKQAIWKWISDENFSTKEATKYVPQHWLGQFHSMQRDYAEALKTYRAINEDINSSYKSFLDNNIPLTEAELSKFQRTVQGVLASFNKDKNNVWWADNTKNTHYYDYLSNLRNAWKDIKEKIADAGTTQGEQIPKLEEELRIIEAIAKSLGIYIDTRNITGESGKSQAEKDLEAQAAAIKKVKDAYDTLSPYLNGIGMTGALKTLFPSVNESIIDNIKSYRKQIEDVADSLDKIGDESSKKAAENLRLSVGGNEAQDMANTLRDIKEYNDLISKWTGIKFEIEGGGIEYKASKLAYEENKAIAESTQKKIEAEEKLYAIKSELHEKVYNRNLELIKELYDIEVANAKKITREKTIALAKGYIDEQLKDGNINLTDFRDKSAGQIKNLISRLGVIESQIRGEIGKISDVGEDTISDNDINKLELLREALNLIINITKDTKFESFKKSVEYARKLNESVGQLGNQISTLGENIDSNLLKGLGDAVSTISEVADIILECDDVMYNFSKVISDATDGMDSFSEGTSDAKDEISNLAKSSSLITMMVKLVLMFIEKIVNMFSAQYKYQQQLIESGNEYQKTLDKLALNNYDAIFGVDAFGKYATNVEIAERELSKYEKTLNKFKNKKGTILHPDMIGRGTTESAMKDIAKEQGWELYRTNGELNLEAMEAYYDSYSSRLTRKQKAMVKEMIETGKNFTDAQTAQAEYIESLFGNLSDNIADNMINAFLATGDAVSDLEDSFEDLGNTIAKSLLKSFIIDNVLKKYQDDLNILFEGYSKKEISDDEFSYKMGEMISGMKKDIKDGKEFWNVFLQYFQDAGLLTNAGDKDTNNMISGVTEETAQLLSSYINSMRAEQARQGIKIDNIDTNVMFICSWLTSIPNLGDYLTKIEAHTQNIALNTKDILARLDSVITTKGGSTSISIYEE
jgi:hypothetical protein